MTIGRASPLQQVRLMTLIKRRPKQDTTEHRAPDQDRAIEQTFEQGTALDVLPPEDRRHDATAVPQEPLAAQPATPEPAEPLYRDNAKPFPEPPVST